jgi:HPt (histidine-containing phosphotransfer) domain-containing protein
MPDSAKAAGHKPDARLLEIFKGDAMRAAATLRETARGGDLSLFTTTAHAMKSALANIGESDKSAMAARLEKAGGDGDYAFIAAKTGYFIAMLESLALGVAAENAGDLKNVDF